MEDKFSYYIRKQKKFGGQDIGPALLIDEFAEQKKNGSLFKNTLSKNEVNDRDVLVVEDGPFC